MTKLNKIDVNICTKDRPSELSLLLQSLMIQTYKNFDIYILDDASKIPVINHQHFHKIVSALQHNEHRVNIIRNNISRGIAKARQQLVEHTLNIGVGNYILRIDDDTILEPDYIERLFNVIKKGYDIASGVSPLLEMPIVPRDTKHVSPIINEISLDGEGKFLVNMDDCGYSYLDSLILPAHHFRSNALIKRCVHQKIQYEDNLAKHSFREEEFFSLRAILSGFKIGVDTGAVAWHLSCGWGGERSHASAAQDSINNQKMLNRFVMKQYKKQGNFIKKHNEDMGIFGNNPLKNINKDNNLIYTRDF